MYASLQRCDLSCVKRELHLQAPVLGKVAPARLILEVAQKMLKLPYDSLPNLPVQNRRFGASINLPETSKNLQGPHRLRASETSRKPAAIFRVQGRAHTLAFT